MRKLIEELFARYYQDVYRYLYSLCHDASLSEDLASEVFLEVVKSIAAFRGESDIKTWIFSIARHRWFAYLRKKNREVPTEELPDYIVGGSSPEKQYQDKEMAERICGILDREPERTRKIVLMRVEGYSFCEIGKQIGISENSARVIDFRAKAKIRDVLRKEGFTDV